MLTTTSDTKQHTTKACAYKQTIIIRVYGKSGALLGYLAQPEVTHQYGDLGMCKPWYQITREESNGFVWWRCTCKGSAVYGKRCKHIRAAMILAGELVEESGEAEKKVVGNDMSVADHLLEEEMTRYERELRYERIADLRMRIAHAGLNVTSKSKDLLVQTLLAYRREIILNPQSVPFVSPDMPTSDGNVTGELNPEEVALSEPIAQEPTRAQVIASIRNGVQRLVDSDPDYASEDNGVGPSGQDVEFMHWFAGVMGDDHAFITMEQWQKAATRLQRYKNTQLKGLIYPVETVERVLGFSTAKQRAEAPLGRQSFSLLA